MNVGPRKKRIKPTPPITIEKPEPLNIEIRENTFDPEIPEPLQQ